MQTSKQDLIEPKEYTKYISLDDKIEDLNYYTTYIKFGIGRARSDSTLEVRNGHISKEEGLALIKKLTRISDKYFDDVLEYIE